MFIITKKELIVYIFIGFIITSWIILSMVEDFNEERTNYKTNFDNLGGCEECGDVLVKCNNGSYEVVKNNNDSIKIICGDIISMGLDK